MISDGKASKKKDFPTVNYISSIKIQVKFDDEIKIIFVIKMDVTFEQNSFIIISPWKAKKSAGEAYQTFY